MAHRQRRLAQVIIVRHHVCGYSIEAAIVLLPIDPNGAGFPPRVAVWAPAEVSNFPGATSACVGWEKLLIFF